MSLPVAQIAQATIQTLSQSQDVILTAPTGSGKSTLLPLLLLNSSEFANKKIIMLEPRRLAAMSVARYMAAQLGEKVGEQVGYRIRQQFKSSAKTRLLVVTEGILTRMLQQDPELAEYALVIFDECHERNLQADLAFALCLDAQQGLREDLRLLMMSATLAVDAFRRCLPEAKLIECEGRQYPVHCHYQMRDPHQNWLPQCFSLIKRALSEQTEGDVLIFLPGVREIHTLYEQAQQDEAFKAFELLKLYGDLPSQAQQQIFAEAPQRRIIFSTNIAETSLTLPRVRVVVDSGFERSMRFVPSAGVGRLELKQVALASAQQRAGRAGRVAEGDCYRLWSEQQQLSFQPTIVPEVLYTELTQLVLELANWGVNEPEQLTWLTLPNSGHWAQAQSQLRWLNAIDDKGTITAHGRAMQRLGLSPRLAHLLVLASEQGVQELALAACCAALLEEKSRGGVEFTRRLEQFVSSEGSRSRLVWQQAQNWFQRAGGSKWPTKVSSVGLEALLIKAFPDRVARLRQENRYATSDGLGVQLPGDDGLLGSHWLLVLNHQLSEHHADAWIRDAVVLEQEQLVALVPEQITQQAKVYWNDSKQKVMAELQTRLGQLILSRKPLPNPDPEQVAEALLAAVAKKGLQLLPWSNAAKSLCERSCLAAQWRLSEEWPDLSESGLKQSLSEWLLPYLAGMRSLAELKQLDLLQILQNYLGYQESQQLATWLPTQFETPLGRKASIEYDAESGAKVAVPMTEMYGFNQKVMLAEGRCELAFELLSPAQRPLQLTKDLPQFWQGSYKEIQKEMKGRYPKHYWPDEPAQAQATRQTKRRMGL